MYEAGLYADIRTDTERLAQTLGVLAETPFDPHVDIALTTTSWRGNRATTPEEATVAEIKDGEGSRIRLELPIIDCIELCGNKAHGLPKGSLVYRVKSTPEINKLTIAGLQRVVNHADPVLREQSRLLQAGIKEDYERLSERTSNWEFGGILTEVAGVIYLATAGHTAGAIAFGSGVAGATYGMNKFREHQANRFELTQAQVPASMRVTGAVKDLAPDFEPAVTFHYSPELKSVQTKQLPSGRWVRFIDPYDDSED